MAFDRRTFIGTTAATGAAVALAGAASTPAAAATQQDARKPGPRTYAFTVMGTTDLHGNVFNWDYFTDE